MRHLRSAALLPLALAPAGACLNRPIHPLDPRTTSIVIEHMPAPADKIDILLDIDNSASMADKQQILAKAVPQLVGRLVNPYCVDSKGNPDTSQPVNPGDPCKVATSSREFQPIADIHVGIVDSSLGGLNSNQCGVTTDTPHMDDQGRLVARDASGNPLPTFMNQGFLAWDANRDHGGISDATQFSSALSALVKGVGQDGCGYENQMEAAVRFLVEPKPYASLTNADWMPIVRSGTDDTILGQRAAFLRPDSLLVVVVLSDEDEHSMNTLDSLDYLPINSGGFHRSTSVCATSPGDPCCTSCGSPTPPGCIPVSSDASCQVNGGMYSPEEDPLLLKQDRMKQQYGFEGRYPVKRYVNAFTQPRIDPSRADFSVDPMNPKAGVENPIFARAKGGVGALRTPDQVFVATITGVPYEDVAIDPKDISKGFKNFSQLATDGFWDKDVGDPDKFVPPTNPIMQETGAKRMGVGPGSPNGGDRSLDATHPPDFQYACIFRLAQDDPNGISCVTGTTIKPDSPDNPLCTLTSGTATEPQVEAKAYPGLRELAVAEGLGAQGIVASICPANPTDESSRETYGYNPAVLSIINQLTPKLGQQCLPHQLQTDVNGDVPCVVIEASHSDSGQTACDVPGRHPIPSADAGAIRAVQTDSEADPNWNNFCVITELESSARSDCQTLPTAQVPAGVDGWCYVDATTSPPIGNPDLVSKCGANEQHIVRFVGQGKAQPGATAIVACSFDSQ